VKTSTKYCLLLLTLSPVFFLGCKNNPFEPKEPSYPIPQEALDFFVNYDVGTCWIYKDTMHANRYDTIELVSKKPYSGITPDGEIPAVDGYQLYYKPGKTKDFTVFVYPYKNNSCNITISPTNFPGSGIEYSEDNGTWSRGYQDSIILAGKTFYDVLNNHDVDYGNFSWLMFAKKIGLISYESYGIPGETYGAWVFVRSFKK